MTTPSNIDPDRDRIATRLCDRETYIGCFDYYLMRRPELCEPFRELADDLLALLRERGRLISPPQETQSARILHEKLQHQAWDPGKAHVGGYAIEYDGNKLTKIPDAPPVVTDAATDAFAGNLYLRMMPYWDAREAATGSAFSALRAALAEMAKQ